MKTDQNTGVSGAPVRNGDMFRRLADRAVITVLENLFAGQKLVRIQGIKKGKRFLHLGYYRISELKTMERIGRASYSDGTYSTPDELIPTA